MGVVRLQIFVGVQLRQHNSVGLCDAAKGAVANLLLETCCLPTLSSTRAHGRAGFLLLINNALIGTPLLVVALDAVALADRDADGGSPCAIVSDCFAGPAGLALEGFAVADNADEACKRGEGGLGWA